jgi:hypothetical protein
VRVPGKQLLAAPTMAVDNSVALHSRTQRLSANDGVIFAHGEQVHRVRKEEFVEVTEVSKDRLAASICI